jgi:hypothetical protein
MNRIFKNTNFKEKIMIKKLMRLFEKDASKSTFWKTLDRKENIKKLDCEINILNRGLEVRQDEEFLEYAVKKYSSIVARQQELLKSY